jgi:peptidoglycan/LPS O-acetylase OafA/YrhL
MTTTPAGPAAAARPIERVVSGHLPSLDGLRGLAIAMVVVHNAAALQTTAPNLFLKGVLAFHGVGWIGVQLFFVLSGFLITGILLDTKGAPRFYSAFYARRALRIFPLYYGLLFAWLVIFPLVAPHAAELVGGPRKYQVWYWTYLSNWAHPYGREIGGLPHFWSLAVEEQFYFVWPLCVALLRPRSLGRLALFMMFAALVFRIVLTAAHAHPNAAYMFTFARMDALAMGAWMALVARDRGVFAALRPRLQPAAIVTTIALIVIALGTKGFHFESGIVQTIGYSLLALLSGVVVLLAAASTGEGGGRLTRVLEGRSLAVLGKYSYGLYVFHVPILALLRHRAEWTINHGPTLQRMMALVTFVGTVSVLSMAAAIASYELVEKRCLALKRYFVARPAAYGASVHSGTD